MVIPFALANGGTRCRGALVAPRACVQFGLWLLSRRFANAPDAGFDDIALHQVGPDQRGFLEFWERELAPKAASRAR
jgi:hypothetical protein